MLTATVDPTNNAPLGVTLASSSGSKGAKVVECHPDDLIARAGIHQGAFIVEIDGEAVGNHEQALHLMQAKSQPFTIGYWHSGDPNAGARSVRAYDLAARAGLFALTCCSLTLSTMLSGDKANQAYGLVGYLALIGAFLLLKQQQQQRLRQQASGIGGSRSFVCVALWAGRMLLALASVSIGISLMFFWQEVWRCTSDLCWQATIYKSPEECRAPCAGADQDVPVAPRSASFLAAIACTIGVVSLLPFVYLHTQLPTSAASGDPAAGNERQDAGLRASQEVAAPDEAWTELNEAALAARAEAEEEAQPAS